MITSRFGRVSAYSADETGDYLLGCSQDRIRSDVIRNKKRTHTARQDWGCQVECPTPFHNPIRALLRCQISSWQPQSCRRCQEHRPPPLPPMFLCPAKIPSPPPTMAAPLVSQRDIPRHYTCQCLQRRRTWRLKMIWHEVGCIKDRNQWNDC